jgi:septal ring factor EnvC (AmiA/AmiB activator)
MDTLRKQIARVRRRLVLQQFLGVLAWAWFATLLAAATAIFVQKQWLSEVDGWRWAGYWLGGAVALGLIVAFAWTLVFRLPELDAAIELDRRFGLKERVSSSLALAPEDFETPAGRALLDDTIRRVGKLDVDAKFPLVFKRSTWLPALPAALAFAFCFLADPTRSAQSDAQANTVGIKKQIKESLAPLPKNLSQIREKAEDNKMSPELVDQLRKVEDGSRDLAKKDEGDRNQALSKLNDLAKELEQRREKLADGEKFKDQLAAMKNMPKGPADKLAQDLKNGDFSKALKELQNLQKQLSEGKLDPEKMKELVQQMEAMKESLQKIVDNQQKMQETLKQQIEKAQKAGDTQTAQNLQQQLSQLQSQQSQMNQLQDMANKMGQSAQAMKEGKTGEAQAALNKMASDLQSMQSEMAEMQMIDGALAEIESAKTGMGQQGQGNSDGRDGRKGGNGFADKGKANGAEGDRPERVHDTKTFDSRVKQEVGKGSFVINGLVEGPNAKGQVMEEIKTQVEAAKHESEDPLTGQRLPRQQRDHVQQYFDAFRKGG